MLLEAYWETFLWWLWKNPRLTWTRTWDMSLKGRLSQRFHRSLSVCLSVCLSVFCSPFFFFSLAVELLVKEFPQGFEGRLWPEFQGVGSLYGRCTLFTLLACCLFFGRPFWSLGLVLPRASVLISWWRFFSFSWLCSWTSAATPGVWEAIETALAASCRDDTKHSKHRPPQMSAPLLKTWGWPSQGLKKHSAFGTITPGRALRRSRIVCTSQGRFTMKIPWKVAAHPAVPTWIDDILMFYA